MDSSDVKAIICLVLGVAMLTIGIMNLVSILTPDDADVVDSECLSSCPPYPRIPGQPVEPVIVCIDGQMRVMVPHGDSFEVVNIKKECEDE